MLTVYIEEAHAVDDWALTGRKMPDPEMTTIKFHKSLSERLTIASKFVQNYNYPIDLVCDSMTGEVMTKYEGEGQKANIPKD